MPRCLPRCLQRQVRADYAIGPRDSAYICLGLCIASGSTRFWLQMILVPKVPAVAGSLLVVACMRLACWFQESAWPTGCAIIFAIVPFVVVVVVVVMTCYGHFIQVYEMGVYPTHFIYPEGGGIHMRGLILSSFFY